jgi:hypothetical protein
MALSCFGTRSRRATIKPFSARYLLAKPTTDKQLWRKELAGASRSSLFCFVFSAKFYVKNKLPKSERKLHLRGMIELG